MMDDVLFLLATTPVQDEYGVIRETITSRQVFCQVNSVSRAEFFGGGRNGLNPEYKFTIFAADYEGESICEFQGNSYTIYRTYRIPDSDTIELYAERRGGTNGKE